MNPHKDIVYYEIAGSEIATGKPDPGIFAKAYSAALGEEAKTKALYIQYRVEQLKAEVIRHQKEEARKEAMGRGEYLSELKREFQFLTRCRIPDSDSPSRRFTGTRKELPKPRSLSDVAEALNMLEFVLIDAVKAGLIDGVLEEADEWWISVKGAKIINE